MAGSGPSTRHGSVMLSCTLELMVQKVSLSLLFLCLCDVVLHVRISAGCVQHVSNLCKVEWMQPAISGPQQIPSIISSTL